ncbi:hypothetical protein M8J75_009310 [Diaphorina citri]|nr:hypothetical protein M8J75_009310 [Diaphorina citri]
MDACMNVEKEVDKVLSKFSDIQDHAQRTVDDTAQYVANLKNELDQCPPDHELTTAQLHILKDALQKVKDTVQRLAADHRDLHSTVSKVGKTIDRNFVSDFAVISKDDVFSGPGSENLLNQVICKHFYRQGMLEIADELAKEANLETDTSNKEPFTDLNKILDALKKRDLSPALQWAHIHREQLQAQNSSLEFRLHQLQFISLVQKGMSAQNEAIAYARMYLSQFVNRHEKDIQTMMGMLMYLPHGIACSPYAHLLESALWGEISDVFIRDACCLLGLSLDSPLTVSVNAGCVALPALLNIKQIEIDLGSNHRYHSVFACPILKTQSTETNPPMRLVCGHVISREALNKLGTATKLKCPYCPVEQSPAEARQIHF